MNTKKISRFSARQLVVVFDSTRNCST